jgi:osmotically-inducible protein OsmY
MGSKDGQHDKRDDEVKENVKDQLDGTIELKQGNIRVSTIVPSNDVSRQIATYSR